MCPKRMEIGDVVVIGEAEGGIYKLKGHSNSNIIESTINPCELWHRRLAHMNYKALPIVSKVVTGFPEIQNNHEGVFKGCAQWKITKNPFPSSNNKAKGTLDIVYLDI